MSYFSNRGEVNAKVGTIDVWSESIAKVEMPALTLIKTAAPLLWTGDELTYNVQIENTEEAGTTVTEIVFTDLIDKNIATLVDGSVIINGTAAQPGEYSFDVNTGVLRIELEELASGEGHEISFRVKKVLV